MVVVKVPTVVTWLWNVISTSDILLPIVGHHITHTTVIAKKRKGDKTSK